MPYIKAHSATRKALTEFIFFVLLALLVGTGGLSAWGQVTTSELQGAVSKIIAVIFSLIALLFVYFSGKRIAAIFRYTANWRIHIDNRILRFSSPDPAESKSCEYKLSDIQMFERKEFYDDGTYFSWFLHVEENGKVSRAQLEIDPFSPDVIANYLKNHGPPHIRFVEINLKGRICDWRQTLFKRVSHWMISMFGALIFAFVIVRAVIYWLSTFVG